MTVSQSGGLTWPHPRQVEYEARRWGSGGPLRASHVVVSLVLAIVAMVGVTFLVAWLLEDTIEFSLMCGIPLGIVAATIVAVATMLMLRSREGPS